jgi:hypothetical protein
VFHQAFEYHNLSVVKKVYNFRTVHILVTHLVVKPTVLTTVDCRPPRPGFLVGAPRPTVVNTVGLANMNLGRYPNKTRRAKFSTARGPKEGVKAVSASSFPTQIACFYGSTNEDLAAVQVGECGLSLLTNSK